MVFYSSKSLFKKYYFQCLIKVFVLSCLQFEVFNWAAGIYSRIEVIHITWTD